MAVEKNLKSWVVFLRQLPESLFRGPDGGDRQRGPSFLKKRKENSPEGISTYSLVYDAREEILP
ncbi:MAG: hypothetical protein RLN70_09000, partial [Rhodospirillaceae bacterium]